MHNSQSLRQKNSRDLKETFYFWELFTHAGSVKSQLIYTEIGLDIVRGLCVALRGPLCLRKNV
jgi:hypothetical protein